MQSRKSSAAALAFAASAFSAAASTFVPAVPMPFETVNLRLTVDSCAFDPSTVSVTTTSRGIEVQRRDNQCLVAGPPRNVEIRLGQYPAGTYAVLVTTLAGDVAEVRERLQLTVPPVPQIAIFPPPPRPLTDYTAMWFDPAQPGRGVSVHQSPSDSLFAVSFEYATTGSPAQPTWYVFSSGRWTGATTWQGSAFLTTWAPFSIENLGPVSIDFDVPAPTSAGRPSMRITYPVPGGGTVTRILTRQPL